jgi:hypothetical protein
MAGIVFPVLLHLWNDRQGKVLSVGSVALLEKRSPRQTWSRRLSEWWLLLLRCLLLMALALLLAGPSWKRGAGDPKKGWLLEERGGDSLHKPLIDSLLRVGYERHDWNADGSYWDAFRAADKEAPEGIPFYIFTPGWASRFQGSRPSTDRSVHWYTYTPVDSVSHWIGGTWLVSPDSIRIAEGSSRPTGSSFSYRMAAAGQLSVSVDSQPPVSVDTAALRITIYADADHIHDSRYLVAAVHALEQFVRRRVRLNITGRMPGHGLGKEDWLFWLSSQPAPDGVWASHVLQYEPGTGTDRHYETVWKEEDGRALLGRERTGHGVVYHFFSRFDPGWNRLVWNRSFPAMLGGLLFGEANRWDSRDRRVLDPEQVMPAKSAGEMKVAARAGDRGAGEYARVGGTGQGTLDLGPACWVLIVLLFILERVVSFNTPAIKNYVVDDRAK